MADGGPDERQCIGSINRSLKRYGSTCNHVKRPSLDNGQYAIVRHDVEEGDTLQGLALKYGTTVRRTPNHMTFQRSACLFADKNSLLPIGDQVNIFMFLARNILLFLIVFSCCWNF
jgi:hypothetical protein